MTSWAQSGATNSRASGSWRWSSQAWPIGTNGSRSPQTIIVGASIAWSSAGVEQRLDGDVGGDRRQQRPPRADALARVVAAGEHDRPVRVVDVGPPRVHQPPGDRRARLALRADADDDERPQPLRERGRELQRGHRPHREAEEVERLEPERLDERGEVVDQPVVPEAVGSRPSA